MNDARSPNDMRNLWQSQEVEPIKMSLEEIRKRARLYQRKIRWRNAREYAAAALIVVYFAFVIWKLHDPIQSIGPGLLMAGALYIAYQLHGRASARTVPADMACIDFYRGELSRQILYLRNIWRWYLGPMIPGLVVILFSAAVNDRGHWRYARLFEAVYVVFGVLLFLLVARLNQNAARRLQRILDDLNATETAS